MDLSGGERLTPTLFSHVLFVNSLLKLIHLTASESLRGPHSPPTPLGPLLLCPAFPSVHPTSSLSCPSLHPALSINLRRSLSAALSGFLRSLALLLTGVSLFQSLSVALSLLSLITPLFLPFPSCSLPSLSLSLFLPPSFFYLQTCCVHM